MARLVAVHADQLAVGRVHQPRARGAPGLPMPAAPDVVYVAARRAPDSHRVPEACFSVGKLMGMLCNPYTGCRRSAIM